MAGVNVLFTPFGPPHVSPTSTRLVGAIAHPKHYRPTSSVQCSYTHTSVSEFYDPFPVGYSTPILTPAPPDTYLSPVQEHVIPDIKSGVSPYQRIFPKHAAPLALGPDNLPAARAEHRHTARLRCRGAPAHDTRQLADSDTHTRCAESREPRHQRRRGLAGWPRHPHRRRALFSGDWPDPRAAGVIRQRAAARDLRCECRRRTEPGRNGVCWRGPDEAPAASGQPYGVEWCSARPARNDWVHCRQQPSKVREDEEGLNAAERRFLQNNLSNVI